MDLKLVKPVLIGDRMVNPGETATEADETRATFLVSMGHAEDVTVPIGTRKKGEEKEPAFGDKKLPEKEHHSANKAEVKK